MDDEIFAAAAMWAAETRPRHSVITVAAPALTVQYRRSRPILPTLLLSLLLLCVLADRKQHPCMSLPLLEADA
jgi:hypothetical protein